MSYSTTRITTRGYDVTLPTQCVGAFLALSHDDQVELADDLAIFDEPTVGDNTSVELLIESMAQDLDAQDQAIDTFMIERTVLQAEINEKRREIEQLVDISNKLYTDAEGVNNILLQSAVYVGKVRELLGQLGIEIKTDSDGNPVIVADLDDMLDYISEAA